LAERLPDQYRQSDEDQAEGVQRQHPGAAEEPGTGPGGLGRVHQLALGQLDLVLHQELHVARDGLHDVADTTFGRRGSGAHYAPRSGDLFGTPRTIVRPVPLRRPSRWTDPRRGHCRVPACRRVAVRRRRLTVASSAARTEPSRTAALAWSTWSGWPAKASSATSSATVKPMPARMPIELISRHVMPPCRCAPVILAVSQAPPVTPIALPTTSPMVMPRVTGWVTTAVRAAGSRRTPAVNRANTGTAKPAETGAQTWPQRSTGSWASFGELRVSRPSSTPEMVACTPESNMNHQQATNNGTCRYHLSRRRCCSTNHTTPQASASPNDSQLTVLVNTIAITMIAPRSSTIARVSRKARRLGGRRGATTASTATAKAMSVAIGTAHPTRLPSGEARLMPV